MTGSPPQRQKENPGYSQVVADKLRSLYSFLKDIVVAFSEHEIALRASALAFSALLSLFPLLLSILFITGRFVQGPGARSTLIAYLGRAIPLLAGTVDAAIDQVLETSTSLGIVAGVGLVWVASAVFTILSSTFNIIWGARQRSFWHRRLIGLLSVLVLAVLFIFSLLLRTVDAFRFTSSSFQGIDLIVDFGVTLVLTWILYILMPSKRVHLVAALGGAALAASLWQLAKAGYSIYLEFAIDRLDLTYGSLGSVVVVLLWMYFSSLILFVGAEVAARLQESWA